LSFSFIFWLYLLAFFLGLSFGFFFGFIFWLYLLALFSPLLLPASIPL
jgi:hypothetical protein